MSRDTHEMQRFCTKALLLSASTCLLATPTLALQETVTPTSISDETTGAVTTTTAGSPIATAAGAGFQADQDTYPSAFFNQYTPQNAMDMIRRLPGFSFDQGSDVRGFGGAAGNVLIDGSRPTSKAGGLRSALRRIPAAQVERIVILRGGANAGEAAGQSVVANVIRKSGGTSGTWKSTIRRQPNSGRVYPQIEGTLTSKIGAWDTTFEINTGTEGGYRTAEIVELDATETLVDVADEDFVTKDHWFIIGAEGSRPLAGGKLTLNGRIDRWRGDRDTDRTGYIGRFQSGSQDTLWYLDETTDNLEMEFGLTWNRTFSNGWRMNAIGLINTNNREYESGTTDSNFIDDTSTFDEYFQDKDKSELIARTTYGKTTGALKPEFGIEVAQNKLHNFVEDFPGGVFSAAGSEDVHVKELRGEAFATLNYQARPDLTIESGLTYEASRINVTGDADQEQTFKFLKPRIAATYAFNDDIQLTLEAERTIGQLDLNNFGSSQQAEDDRVTAGNPNLQPDKTKKIGATFDWKFSERGSLKVEALHEWRSDILEQIILPDGSEGLGNAGNARFWAIVTDLKLPLDFALPGGLLEVKHFYRRSSFKDPVLNGDDSLISDYTPNWVRMDFRQDLPEHKFSWGITYWGSFGDSTFNVSEISRVEGNKRLRFFIETTRFFGVKTRFSVRDANTGRFDRTRFFHDGSRAGALTGTEVAKRVRRPFFEINFSGTF